MGFAVVTPVGEMMGLPLSESVAKWSGSGREEGFELGEVAALLASSERARCAEESMSRMGAGRWMFMDR